MATPAVNPPIRTCSGCGYALPAALLSCPSCERLVHKPRLEELASSAQAAEVGGDITEATRLWREALELLPPDTQQFRVIAARLSELSQRIDHGSAPAAPGPHWLKRFGPLAPLAFLLWKFKALILLALTKGKLLLLGLTKMSTLSTMLLSMGAYWTLYGWRFAAGLVLSIYIHETGHVYALRQFGIRATAPLFIPFLGAIVGLRQRVFSRVEEARVGLAGPAWGLAAAVAAFAAYGATGSPVLGVVAHFGAWLNLFNLLPVWQLDGSRGFAALSRKQRGFLLILMLALWPVAREGFLLLLAAATVYRLTLSRDWPETGDARTLRQFAGLLICLTLLLAIPLPKTP